MLEINEYLCSMRLKTSSTFNEIGAVLTAVVDFLRCHDVGGQAANQTIIVIRELLINAMKHGNKFNERTPVTICISKIKGKQFKIVVQDFGDGFDYKRLETALPDDPKNLRSRGYRLVKAYSDSFEFNQRGNEVTAYISAS